MALSGGVFYQVNKSSISEPSVPPASQADDISAAQRADLEKSLAQFFDKEARPLLEETRGKDLAAIAQVLNSLDTAFKRYETGVPKFASALTGWGTRFKIIYRKGVESVQRKEEHTWTQQLVQEKFSEHVMSDTNLEKDLIAILKQFNFDLEANRNEMLAGIQTKLAASHLPVKIQSLPLEIFKAEFAQNLTILLKSMPQQSVGIGVGSLAAGIAAEEAVRQIIRSIIAQLTVRIAASAAATGGAAGGAAAAGAAGGSVVAPGLGTVIGLAGGFLFGAVVDWWMTDAFEEKVGRQCKGFLDATKASLLEGEGGLKNMLVNQIEQSSRAYDRAVQSSIQP